MSSARLNESSCVAPRPLLLALKTVDQAKDGKRRPWCHKQDAQPRGVVVPALPPRQVHGLRFGVVRLACWRHEFAAEPGRQHAAYHHARYAVAAREQQLLNFRPAVFTPPISRSTDMKHRFRRTPGATAPPSGESARGAPRSSPTEVIYLEALVN